MFQTESFIDGKNNWMQSYLKKSILENAGIIVRWKFTCAIITYFLSRMNEHFVATKPSNNYTLISFVGNELLLMSIDMYFLFWLEKNFDRNVNIWKYQKFCKKKTSNPIHKYQFFNWFPCFWFFSKKIENHKNITLWPPDSNNCEIKKYKYKFSSN
jgi:hypothetical protein